MSNLNYPDYDASSPASNVEQRQSAVSPDGVADSLPARTAAVSDDHLADDVPVSAFDECAKPRSDVVGAAAAARSSISSGDEGERSANLPEEAPASGCCGRGPLHAIAHAFNYVVPRGGILSGALNLASVTFGAGVMSYPSAFNTAGLAMAMIYLVVVTLFTIFSIRLLAEVSDKTGLMSFESLARNLFGPGADIFVACVMWLLCFGGAIGYVIAVGDIFTAIFQSKPSLPAFLRSSSGRRCLQSAVWLLFMLPASMPKQINSLRYLSLVGVAFIVFFVFCVVGHAAQNAFDHGVRSDLIMFRTGNDGVSAVSIFIFGYLNQVNSIAIAREARPRSVHRMTITAALSCGICAVLYFLIGFFGYCDFGPEVSGNILLYFNPFAYPIFFVCYIGIIVKLIASFSQNMFACRTALFQVIRWNVDTLPYWKHSIVAGLFSVAALILGLFVPDINIVFGLVGGFCGGFVGFVFPSLFSMYSGNWTLRSVGLLRYLLTYALLITGVIAIVFGTVATIYSTIVKYS